MSAAVIAQMRAALTAALNPAALEIVDDSARHVGHAGARGGGHYQVRVVAEAFQGLSALERHRLVYGALGPLLQAAVHAVNISARTPQEPPPD